MPGERIFQIFYDEQTRSLLDPDFEPLDNSDNERPDWFEYWPMRRFLRGASLRDASHYGFLSPNFQAKTQLTGRQVKAFVDRHREADVITFSPYPCHAASFLNVFEQAEFTQPGFMHVASAYLRHIGSAVSLQTTVNHSGNSVFSNFFLAKPVFWRHWDAAAERLFRAAESDSGAMGTMLNQETPYMRDDGLAKRAQMKVFLMERFVTLLLSTMPEFAVANYPPFDLPLTSYFLPLRNEVMRLDELKIAYARSGDEALLRAYRTLQEQTLDAASRNQRRALLAK
jgi:hypothetical protein